MKKFILGILFLLSMLPLVNVVSANQPTTQVYLHYFRYAGDYTNWNIWMWQNEPESKGGSAYYFVNDDTSEEYNFGGVVSKINLTGDLEGSTRIGVIIRLGDWAQKDVDNDRFFEVPATSVNGIHHVYFVEGDSAIGSFLNDPAGPDKSPKFKSAFFQTTTTISFMATEMIGADKLVLKAGDTVVTPQTINITGNGGLITLASELDFGLTYTLYGTFSDDSERGYVVTYDGIYSNESFENVFGYTGDDLGAVIHDTKTSFRVWAPVASNVVLNLYDTGTPANFGGTNTPIKTKTMARDVNGTFYTEEPGNLHGTYYTYTVTNGTSTNETIDPYAKSAGINGIRGLVVDFSQTNPTGFVYGQRPQNMVYETDAIIYELHVRDLTVHESWNGTAINRGRFLGLIESGTKYEGVTTGFDHIVELGVTHVQLLPFFDFGVLDESKINTEGYNSFNWGYMPLNFNVLEGAYSANPYDGLVRIQEMKQVVLGFAAQNIRINMDVVYNHHGLTADSNFNLIVPGYYFRKNANGSYSNGSGTGNETSSERIMTRKFMIDSLVFWTNEYNLSGFRFDLMALHDIETMTQIAQALKEIDPTIMIYGEPWMGGTSPLPATDQAGKRGLKFIPNVGAFNDDFRDAVKGSVFNRTEGGFLQGNFSAVNRSRIQYGIVGGIQYEGINPSNLSTSAAWHIEPTKTINYVTAHDNNTLHDKLHISLTELGKLHLLPALMKQGNAMVLTAQGVAFLHAGDEFSRSKPLINRPGFDHNSYESPDEVNQMRWDLKANSDGMEMFTYYKGLIQLRNNHPSFRMPTAQAVRDNLAFVYQDVNKVVAFTLSNTFSNDTLETILVVHNGNDSAVKIKLPTNGGWVVIVNGENAGVDELETFKGGQTVSLSANATYVMYQDANLPDYSPIGWIIGGVSGGVAVIGVVLFFLLKRKVVA